MVQHAIVHQEARRYSRTDFTALRAWVLRLPISRVADLYYCDDAPQLASGLERFLIDMRQDLIERSILANPQLSDMLIRAREGGPVSSRMLDLLIEIAEAGPSAPQSSDHIGQWFRSKVATQLVAQGIKTIGDLKNFIESNGPTWWHPIPRIGLLRARAIIAWLNRAVSTSINPTTQIAISTPQIVSPLRSEPLALQHIASLPVGLDGRDGANRASQFCFIAARNDLEAVRTYILKFRQQPHTTRAYQRELERFLLWSVLIRKKALSSLLVDDCESYKDFLTAPSSTFTGTRRRRFSGQWKPFTGPLSPESQKQAVQILRTAFSWLQDVRYLAGNPWAAVADPRTELQVQTLQIERALPSSLYEKTVSILVAASKATEETQARIALATFLLLGDCGLRISEAAGLTIGDVRPSDFTSGRYQIKVVGKRSKVRMVPITPRALDAVLRHQDDLVSRYPDLAQKPDHALIRPINLPHSKAVRGLHELHGKGYAPNALARLLTKALKALAGLDSVSADEMIRLSRTSAHALRHTYGTLAIEGEMPVDVVQSILGHSSIATTSIYIRAQQRRVAAEAEKLLLSRQS